MQQKKGRDSIIWLLGFWNLNFLLADYATHAKPGGVSKTLNNFYKSHHIAGRSHEQRNGKTMVENFDVLFLDSKIHPRGISTSSDRT